ncbi:brunelleschi-like protein [Sarcoptes scabiei]|uniref:Brunelleschi-like protein n=1 Tax=Sarcoptes scabiei TaxID=52283 RepID=A0A132A189_SARSC|nr:brunelleschi-like protein [Sarcoptes scabiei]
MATTTITIPDYDQFAEDHQCLLIVVKQLGPQMNPKLFKSIYDHLLQLYELKITNNKILGFERTIRIRFKQSYSIEENDWGDFQAHRKLIGLITVARSLNQNEIESIIELHKTIHDTYNNTLFDSRCFIIKTPETQNGTESTTIDQPSFSGDASNLSAPDETNQKYDHNHHDPILDIDFGNQLPSNSSDHNCFTSHVNHSSSTSSSSLLSSSPVLDQASSIYVDSRNVENENLNYSLPPLSVENGEQSIQAPIRGRTHSRNKSLDSRILSPNSTDDHSRTETEAINGGNEFNEQNSFASNITHKRVHSSSSNFMPNQGLKAWQRFGNHKLSTKLSSSSKSFQNSSFNNTHMNEFINYESDTQCSELIKEKTKEFLTNLFWILESKRLDRTREKKEKIPLLMAPCEKKDLIGLDTDTRSFNRKCLGRMQKHIADLTFMAGLPQESFFNYITAIDVLKGVSDKLWLASAYEGLCAVSLALLFPQRWRYIHDFRNRFHYPKGIVHNLLNRNDYAEARNEIYNAIKQIAKEHHPIDFTKTGGDKNLMKNLLSIDQFYEKYKTAASYYAMYRGAATIEFECSFKAAKTLAFFNRNLKASDFIQNAVFISSNQSIEVLVERLLRISNLYEMIGFFRKAAFFKRLAALKTVSLSKSLNWEKCYFLLLPALNCYGLTLDPSEYDSRLQSNSNQTNWPSIHVELLKEIITTSFKMQNETLTIRHLSFMIQCLFSHITSSQRREFATRLSQLASKCGEGSPVQLKLSNGSTIPSVNFTKFPTVLWFKIEPLRPDQTPYKLIAKNSGKNSDRIESGKNHSGPFIYTPLQLYRSSAKDNDQDGCNKNSVKKVNFYWCEGCVGSVSLSLHNYLPIELNISSIMTMTDGVAFEPDHETSLKIDANSTCKNISLKGIPRSSGTLDVLGYRLHTLGIKSDCHLKQLPNFNKLKLPTKFAIEVVPRLSSMSIDCSAAEILSEKLCIEKRIPWGNIKDRFQDCDFIQSSYFVSMFEGQTKFFRLKLSNQSQNQDELIDLVNVSIVYPKQISSDLRNLLNIEWNQTEINEMLPITLEDFIELNLKFSAKGDFVTLPTITKNDSKQQQLLISNKNGINNRNVVKILPTTNNSSASRKFQVLGSKKLANFINELQSKKSSNDLASLNNDFDFKYDSNFRDVKLVNSNDPIIVELCVQFEYSGGPGLNAGFCRRININFVIEIKSSILITHWDVIQAEQIDECYLVIDAMNATDQEINLIYSTNKEMMIEPKEKCRIPVPIRRCSLDQLGQIDSITQSHLFPMDQSHSEENLTKNFIVNDVDAEIPLDFLSFVAPEKNRLDAILLQCRSHLLKQIDLRWTMPNSDNEGTVFVEKVPYSTEILQSILKPPIITARTFKNIRLYLDYYQDFQNSQLNRTQNQNIDEKIIVNGCDSFRLDKLLAKEIHSLHCDLIFLYIGIFKLEICCQPEELYRKMRSAKGAKFTSDSIGANQQNQTLLSKQLHTFEITVEE